MVADSTDGADGKKQKKAERDRHRAESFHARKRSRDEFLRGNAVGITGPATAVEEPSDLSTVGNLQRGNPPPADLDHAAPRERGSATMAGSGAAGGLVMSAKRCRKLERDQRRAAAFHSKHNAATEAVGVAPELNGLAGEIASIQAEIQVAVDAAEYATAAQLKDRVDALKAASADTLQQQVTPTAATAQDEGTKESKRSERDKRRAEAFAAQKAAAAGDSGGAAAAAATVVGTGVQGAAGDGAGGGGSKKSERDKRRAEAFLLKKKQLAAGGGSAPVGSVVAGSKPRLKKGALSKKPDSKTPQWLLHQWKRVFVSNLGYEIDDVSVRAFFRNAGEIVRTKWLTDPKTKDFKGCVAAQGYQGSMSPLFVSPLPMATSSQVWLHQLRHLPSSQGCC